MRPPIYRRMLLVLPLLLAAGARAAEPAAVYLPISHSMQLPSADAYAGSPLQLPYNRSTREQWEEQLLDLEPDRRNRQLIEQARLAEGIDVTEEEWVEVDDTTLTWGGRLQGDWVTWANDLELGGQSNYFEFRRLRLFAAGEGYGVFDYMLELEFANESRTEIGIFTVESSLVEVKDAYLTANYVPYLGQVRIGHFMAPLGLEQLTSTQNTTFLERSFAMEFVPGREVGIAAFNHSPGENVTWAAGAFFDDISDSSYAVEDDSQGVRLVSRLTCTPFYDVASEGRHLLHTGLGYAYTQPRRRNNQLGVPFYPIDFEAQPEIGRADDLIETGDLNAQRYHVLDAELAMVMGPLSLQGEMVWTRVREYQLGELDFFGSYVYASYFLTGENRAYDRREGSFRGITPLENFWIVDTLSGPQAGWGAWELAARWSYLDFTDIANQQLNELTVGCNWYWNPDTRFMFNWIHPFTHNSLLETVPNAEADILAMRLEVNF